MAKAPKRQKIDELQTDAQFAAVVNKMLRTPPKPHEDMKVGKGTRTKSASKRKKSSPT